MLIKAFGKFAGLTSFVVLIACGAEDRAAANDPNTGSSRASQSGSALNAPFFDDVSALQLFTRVNIGPMEISNRGDGELNACDFSTLP